VSTSRDRILGDIARTLGPGGRARAAAAERRIASPRASVIPARGQGDRLAVFTAEALLCDATIDEARGAAEVPALVAAYLAGQSLGKTIRCAPGLKTIPWRQHLEVDFGIAEPEDAVGVSGAFAGIAETGTVMLLSGPECPTTLAFLPETHIVVLGSRDIVGAYEDAWARLRVEQPNAMPRSVNWITGPSRTADIEQTLFLGAHGPRRLHIVIVHDQET
jgi:L-lactate dehydrogenase complex protein LldG